MLNPIHPISIICSDYERSKAFYNNILGLIKLSEKLSEKKSNLLN